MPRCCVPECTSGTFRDRKSLRDAGARDRSYFAFPKNIDLLAKWKEILFDSENEVELNKHSKVCEHHFRETDIIKSDVLKLFDGSSYTSDRLKYKLQKGAVPISLAQARTNNPQDIVNRFTDQDLEKVLVQVCEDIEVEKRLQMHNNFNTYSNAQKKVADKVKKKKRLRDNKSKEPRKSVGESDVAFDEDLKNYFDNWPESFDKEQIQSDVQYESIFEEIIPNDSSYFELPLDTIDDVLVDNSDHDNTNKTRNNINVMSLYKSLESTSNNHIVKKIVLNKGIQMERIKIKPKIQDSTIYV